MEMHPLPVDIGVVSQDYPVLLKPFNVFFDRFDRGVHLFCDFVKLRFGVFMENLQYPVTCFVHFVRFHVTPSCPVSFAEDKKNYSFFVSSFFVSSFFSSCSPEMDFLNSRIPLPRSLAIFGSLFAPNTISTMRNIKASSQGPIFPKKAR